LSYCPLWAALGRLRHSTIMTGEPCQVSTGDQGSSAGLLVHRVLAIQRQNFFISIRSRSFSLFLGDVFRRLHTSQPALPGPASRSCHRIPSRSFGYFLTSML